MSPVSKRRTRKPARQPGRPPLRPSSRNVPALDVLTRELVKVATVTDAFTVEGVGTYLFDVLDRRGPTPDDAFPAFCHQVVDDPRAVESRLGLEALALVAALGPAGVRDDARAVMATASDDVRASAPAWCDQLGAVHLVEGGALRTLDGSESVLHLMFDYDDRGAGSRHLLTMGVEHGEARVHVLDVRGRQPDDTLAPIAASYAASEEPVWTWLEVGDIAALVADAVRETARHTERDWPLLDVDNADAVTWILGVRRLEQLTGLDLTTRTEHA